MEYVLRRINMEYIRQKKFPTGSHWKWSLAERYKERDPEAAVEGLAHHLAKSLWEDEYVRWLDLHKSPKELFSLEISAKDVRDLVDTRENAWVQKTTLYRVMLLTTLFKLIEVLHPSSQFLCVTFSESERCSCPLSSSQMFLSACV